MSWHWRLEGHYDLLVVCLSVPTIELSVPHLSPHPVPRGYLVQVQSVELCEHLSQLRLGHALVAAKAEGLVIHLLAGTCEVERLVVEALHSLPWEVARTQQTQFGNFVHYMR